MKTLIPILLMITTLACKFAGGRLGLHGMVLYGANGTYILDHIPMEHAPHDMQVLAQVRLISKKGILLTQDFSKATFTLRPSANFSLDDYTSGKILTFEADLFQGGFEQGGPVLPGLDSVTVKVERILHHRQLPSASAQSLINIGIFEANVITPERNVQRIRNTMTGKVLWCVKGPEFFEACD